MVLVGNEWQNKCEDVPKTTDTTTTTTSPATSAAGSIAAKINHNISETEEEYLINSAAEEDSDISIIKDNSLESTYTSKLNNDDDINKSQITDVEKIFTSNKKINEDNLEESVFSRNNNIKIMAENTKEFPVKEDNEHHVPLSQTIINDHLADNNKDVVETDSRHNSNSDTSTLAYQQENNRQQSVIQTNTTNNANISVAGIGLQPNFLSQLALTANVAGIQKSTTLLSAKELNQSFNILDPNNQIKSDSKVLESCISTSSVPAPTYDNNGQAKIVLICEGNSHPFQTRSICLTPNIECMVGRLIAKSKASENNAIFDCKVLSRKHAVIWYTPDGKFWVKDTKSSNGTFINDNKLGDEEAQLHFGDIVKFGVDVLENSRKEVHGCIIACVKLYMPDGREAISIESSAHRSQFSGEGRISYDELHRLNLYIQETSQREKMLSSKLFNIQNVLDSTRKKSALCWQSMITEDQLLHRIQALEKKLQFMEKNVPENVLRNEVLKLLDDKSSYQHTAKEALRKVYQERCDAMQMLAKMEAAYSQSDNECSVLRDQIMNSKQTLQDVNTRLLRLETEYNEYKDEVARQQLELKNQEELRISELTEKLRERESECTELNKKISDLLIKRAELFEDEEQLLEKQAIEKLDAAIADMDLGEDENISENETDADVNDVKIINEEREAKNGNDAVQQENEVKFAMKLRKPTTRPQIASIFADTLNGVVESSKLNEADAVDVSKANKSPPKRVKKTTIMKWLQNSDLNKNEGSFDIFKAICCENENDDVELKDTKFPQVPETLPISEANLLSNFRSKLNNVQTNLKQLELEIKSEMSNETCGKGNCENVDYDSSDEDVSDAQPASAGCEFIIQKTQNSCIANENQVLSNENKRYLLLKSSVDMLREAYNEIWDTVKDKDVKESIKHEETQKAMQSFPKSNSSSSTTISLQLNSPAVQYPDSDNTESDSEVESLSLSSAMHSSICGTVVDSRYNKNNDPQILERIQEYQSQVKALNEKLLSSEMEAQHNLEIMEVQCDDFRLKIKSLNETIEALKSDKNALQQAINDNENNLPCFEIKTTENLELEEDPINVTDLEREEELITYKERLEEQQRENILLRNEITLLKKTANAESKKDMLIRQYLPYCVIVLAIIIYFATTYY